MQNSPFQVVIVCNLLKTTPMGVYCVFVCGACVHVCVCACVCVHLCVCALVCVLACACTERRSNDVDINLAACPTAS